MKSSLNSLALGLPGLQASRHPGLQASKASQPPGLQTSQAFHRAEKFHTPHRPNPYRTECLGDWVLYYYLPRSGGRGWLSSNYQNIKVFFHLLKIEVVFHFWKSNDRHQFLVHLSCLKGIFHLLKMEVHFPKTLGCLPFFEILRSSSIFENMKLPSICQQI